MLVVVLFWVFLAAPAMGQEKGWETEWNQIVAAAKKEGKVVVTGAGDPEVRLKIPAAFKARFGVSVEYLVAPSSQIAAKLRIERRVGVTTIDVFLAGANTAANILYPAKLMAPLKPALILPQVVDPSKWKQGRLWFIDPEEKYFLRLLNFLSDLLFINTRFVNPEELKSIKELLHSKWKGKIAVYDPTRPGAGSNTAAKLHVQMGGEFVKKLYIDQKPFIVSNRYQLSDLLARGTYPISPDVDSEDYARLKRDGFPITAMQGFSDMPGVINGANGNLALMDEAPHPNAARLFVNWMASKEALEIFSKATLYPTTRNDVDESFLLPERVPRPGVNYFDVSTWDFTVTQRPKLRLQMKELLGAR